MLEIARHLCTKLKLNRPRRESGQTDALNKIQETRNTVRRRTGVGEWARWTMKKHTHYKLFTYSVWIEWVYSTTAKYNVLSCYLHLCTRSLPVRLQMHRKYSYTLNFYRTLAREFCRGGRWSVGVHQRGSAVCMYVWVHCVCRYIRTHVLDRIILL